MLFNSPEFLLLFLPLTCAVYAALVRTMGGRAGQLLLVIASMAFYAYWDVRYLALLLSSTCVNYWLGSLLAARRRRLVLAAGIAANLGVLGYFKYMDFAIENINAMLGFHMPVLHIILPLGISFFTFQKIAYLVDSYRGEVLDRDPLRFILFVMFFPQLIAGPIVHHSQIIPQLKQHQTVPVPPDSAVARGLFLLVVGLFKKVVIADYLVRYVTPAFANVESLHFIDAWTAALAYALQLYFDFSAYSEMALGIALLFGITLPQNFNSPYKAVTITEFWRRWHITLGAFMRDYVYIPLGGNRRGLALQLVASMATMLLGGLWHGAGWGFVLWGAMHGSYLVCHKVWRHLGRRMNAALAQLLTLTAVIVAWVPFRATSVHDALHMWSVMFGGVPVVLPASYTHIPLVSSLGTPFAASPFTHGFEIFGLVLLAKTCLHMPNVFEIWPRIRPNAKWAGALSGAALVSLFSISNPTTFLYFQF